MNRRSASALFLIAALLLLGGCAHMPGVIAARDPLTPQEHLRLGAAYEAQGLRVEALRQYETAVRADKACAQCWLALGNMKFADGRLKDAEKSFRKALAAAPQNPAAGNNLATVLLARNGSLTEADKLAQAALTRAVTIRPHVLDTLANIRLRQGRYAEAADLVGRAQDAAAPGDRPVLDQLAFTRARILKAAEADASAPPRPHP